ncbi:MAG: hypothetical protein PsegKO_25060 [Pseudohongiellaceae bacterium]
MPNDENRNAYTSTGIYIAVAAQKTLWCEMIWVIFSTKIYSYKIKRGKNDTWLEQAINKHLPAEPHNLLGFLCIRLHILTKVD